MVTLLTYTSLLWLLHITNFVSHAIYILISGNYSRVTFYVLRCCKASVSWIVGSYTEVNLVMRGGLAAWHLPGGPVGLASRGATTSNIEVGQATYPVNRGMVGMERRKGQSHKEEEREGGSGMGRWPRLRGP